MADEDDLVEAFTAEDPTILQKESHLVILKRSTSKRCCVISFIIAAICLAVAMVVIVALAVALAMANSDEGKGLEGGQPGTTSPTSSISPSPTVNHSISPSPTVNHSISPSPTVNPTQEVCLTESCVQLAAKVLSGLDQSINPCVDFYNFTCGNWIYDTIIPKDSGEYDAFSILDDLNTQRLAAVMEGPNGNDVDAIVKAKDLYQSCMNTNLTNDLGLQPLLDVLAMSGGWALIGQSVTIPWGLNGEAFLKEKMYDSPAFFTLTVEMNEMNPSEFIIYVENSGLTLDYDFLYPWFTDELKAQIIQMLNALNPEIDNATYVAAADGIVQLETNLAMIFEDVYFFDEPPYNKYTLDELTTLWPDFDWVDQVGALFNDAGVNDVDGNEPIIVRTPYYFGNLTEVLRQFDAATLENYAKWQLVHTYLPFLDDECVAAYNNLKKATTGSVEFSNRTELCIESVQEILPLSVGRLYAEYILPEGAMELAANMTTEIAKAFRQRVETRDWLDEATRKRALRKVDLIGQMVAYPDKILDNDWLNGLYSEYMISENLFETYVEITLFINTAMLAQLRNPVDLWTINPPVVTPTIVNAFYFPLLNEIYILEGIIGSPFFQPGWPDYFKYGGLGVVIGHEITHGFDSNGRYFNETGQLEDWWTEDSVANFVDRQQCFVEQYSDYGYYGMNVNGSQTLGENIADNGGIVASYNAYKSVLERTGNVPSTLPGVSYTPDQLYFIAFGQVWCSYYTERAYEYLLEVDEHSPGPFRVIGAVRNSPEFAEAFQCPEGSPMNPKDKCSLW